MVPFTAVHSAITVEPIDVHCPSGATPGKAVLSGKSTHLGEYTGTSISCSVPTSPRSAAFDGASLVLYQRHGDELRLVLNRVVGGGVVVDLDAQGVPEVLVIDAGYDIAGGTGRFDSASGSVTLHAVRSLKRPAAAFAATLEGTISVPEQQRE